MEACPENDIELHQVAHFWRSFECVVTFSRENILCIINRNLYTLFLFKKLQKTKTNDTILNRKQLLNILQSKFKIYFIS